MRRFSSRIISICFHFLFSYCFLMALTSCGSNTEPPPSTATLTAATQTQQLFTSPPPTSTFPPQPTPTIVCTDNLGFIEDVTIPDNSVVVPGKSLDKQWLVQNSGDCNWDARYRLRLISGDALGAPTEQALFPARAGTQATIQILFTAPQEAGNYVSEWQVFDANGIPFGDSFFIKIVVQ